MHLIELHEQPWCPAVFRNALTEWLRVLWERSRAVTVVGPLIHQAMIVSGANRIVDLCAGASGPIGPLQKQLDALGMSVPVLVTDLFPNDEAMSHIEAETNGRVKGCREPVDATALPPGLTGFRTLFNSFHHFSPGQARAILEDAFRNRQPIGIFEITEPKLHKIFFSFPASFFSVFVMILWMHPRRLAWWFFTWIIPAVPFVIAWDGLISHLRSYTPEELKELTHGLSDDSFQWNMGTVSVPGAAMDVAYLLGVPRRTTS